MPHATRLRLFVLGLAALTVPSGTSLQAQIEPVVLVRLYDAAGNEATRAAAQAAAASVMRGAGITIRWRDCSSGPLHDPACLETPESDELLVRLVGSSKGSSGDALGASLIDPLLRRGFLATIFLDRVRALAARADTDPARLLGLALAHEVVHLLRGDTRHSERGLLRALWTVEELRANVEDDWRLAAGESLELRTLLIARAQSGDPETRTAERRPPERPHPSGLQTPQ